MTATAPPEPGRAALAACFGQNDVVFPPRRWYTSGEFIRLVQRNKGSGGTRWMTSPPVSVIVQKRYGFIGESFRLVLAETTAL